MISLDLKLDEVWTEETGKRLKAYREGKLEGVPMEEIFKDKFFVESVVDEWGKISANNI